MRIFSILFSFCFYLSLTGQVDTIKPTIYTFGGSISANTNGFSLIPTFSLGLCLLLIMEAKESGEAALEKGLAKAISYGVLFLANPDLPKRFELDAPLNQADRMTMFGGGEQGYTDYPYLAQ